MTALAGAIDSMFGSDGISEEMIGGTATNEKNAIVTVNGTIEVGTLKSQELVVDSAVDEQNQNLLIFATTQDRRDHLHAEHGVPCQPIEGRI
jgi:hypothetical protein